MLQTQEIIQNKSFNPKNKILTISLDVAKSYKEFKEELSKQATEFATTRSGNTIIFISYKKIQFLLCTQKVFL